MLRANSPSLPCSTLHAIIHNVHRGDHGRVRINVVYIEIPFSSHPSLCHDDYYDFCSSRGTSFWSPCFPGTVLPLLFQDLIQLLLSLRLRNVHSSAANVYHTHTFVLLNGWNCECLLLSQSQSCTSLRVSCVMEDDQGRKEGIFAVRNIYEIDYKPSWLYWSEDLKRLTCALFPYLPRTLSSRRLIAFSIAFICESRPVLFFLSYCVIDGLGLLAHCLSSPA